MMRTLLERKPPNFVIPSGAERSSCATSTGGFDRKITPHDPSTAAAAKAITEEVGRDRGKGNGNVPLDGEARG